MAHINHPVELSTWAAKEAIRRIRETGAVIRTQSPLIRHINDRAADWAQMWEEQVRMGCVPYYMFVERDTGASHYFSIPLARAWDIYQQAVQQVSGLGRTASGPTMSAFPGKVCVEGVAHIHGEKVFVLNFLQCRDPDWVHRPFFAKFDPEACWLDDLEPAFEEQFFFEEKHREQAAS
jgi:L-lysine 2,3-aminomutase